MKYAIPLAILLLTSFPANAGEGLTCSEAKAEVEQQEAQNAFNVSFTNFLRQKHISAERHAFEVNEDYAAVSEYSTYRSHDIEFAKREIRAFEWLFNDLSGVSGGKTLKVPEPHLVDVSFLLLMEMGLEFTPAELHNGVKLTKSEVAELQEAVSYELTILYRNHRLYAAHIFKDKAGQQTVAFIWSNFCGAGKAPETIVSKINGTRVSMDIYCIENDAFSNASFAIANTEAGRRYIHRELSEKEWLNVQLPFEDSSMLTQFWAKGFNRAWTKLGGELY
ncbi:hypothetical protein D515_01812 [Grimontia indica]|uniref:Uncharacterized protein n=1 Tax=Grimontia indica TaxID=1056512 RepID=R1GTG5_9GAMM|nr:hypothetical protein [Grimontia indica]EOD79359.1 hypothetical protein D515_01812 [Grimontia indica]